MKKNENGRSMVEMLGVLAIIGVLSVAGIAGYSVAIRKHRANEIAQAVSMLAIAASTTNAGITEANASYDKMFDNVTIPAGASSIVALDDNNQYNNKIRVIFEDGNVCTAVKEIFGTTTTNSLYAAEDESDCADDTDPHLIIKTN